MLANEKMDKKKARDECERKAWKRLREARMTVEEGTSVSEVFEVFKDTVTTLAAEVVGYRPLMGHTKGSA